MLEEGVIFSFASGLLSSVSFSLPNPLQRAASHPGVTYRTLELTPEGG
jgi:hypothetical protein